MSISNKYLYGTDWGLEIYCCTGKKFMTAWKFPQKSWNYVITWDISVTYISRWQDAKYSKYEIGMLVEAQSTTLQEHSEKPVNKLTNVSIEHWLWGEWGNSSSLKTRIHPIRCLYRKKVTHSLFQFTNKLYWVEMWKATNSKDSRWKH